MPKYFLFQSSFFKKLDSKALIGDFLTFWYRLYCLIFSQPHFLLLLASNLS